MPKRQFDTSRADSGQGLLWLFGVILAVQGFGSAITEAGWNTSFGVAGLLRAAQVPVWGTFLVGCAGAALLATAARRHFTKEPGSSQAVAGLRAVRDAHRPAAVSWHLLARRRTTARRRRPGGRSACARHCVRRQ